ncbi:MAG: hypothetical protein AVDCRST_MAG52-1518, partial [uncultured Blastococcus sp.]
GPTVTSPGAPGGRYRPRAGRCGSRTSHHRADRRRAGPLV